MSEFGFSVDAGVLPDDDEYADIVVGAPGYPKQDGAVVVIHGGPRTIAPERTELITDRGFRFGADVALVGLDSSDSPNLVVVAEDAPLAEAVRYIAGDGNVKAVAGFGSLPREDDASGGLRIAHNAGAE